VAGTKKKENRGGKREGAGRKPGTGPGREALSVRQVKEFQAVAEKLAKEFGYPVIEVAGRIAYDEDAPRRDRLAATKLFLDKVTIAATEGGEADRNLGPAIYLPKQRDNIVKILKE